jgi:hypothetical protein
MADDDAIDAAARSFAAAHKKLKLKPKLDKSAKATAAREQSLLDSIDRRHLPRVTTGRSELWGIRCRPGLKEVCQEIAHARGIPVAQWIEELCDAAIAAHRKHGGKNA